MGDAGSAGRDRITSGSFASGCESNARAGESLPPRLTQQLDFIREVDRLKSVLRQTPLLDRSRRENDAEHCWEVALMAVLLAEYADPPVYAHHVVVMLLVHDLVEIDAGDTFIYDDEAVATQRRRERAAADRIFGLLPAEQGNELRALWQEFEAQQSPEARFAKAMDRLQPLLHNYNTRGGTWRAPGVTEERVLERKELIGLAAPDLWAYARGLIEDAVEQGFLRASEADPAGR
jgi:putative hydrolase of HD superfamily